MKVVAISSFAAVVLCLALANTGAEASALSGLLGNAVSSVVSAVKNVGGVLTAAFTIAGEKVYYELANGFFNVYLLNGTNRVGVVALPLDALCQIPGFKTYATCYICNNDCIYVHNTYGGKCGTNPADNSTFTCLCADTPEDAAARNITKNTRDTCQANSYPPSMSTYLEDPALALVLRARMDVVQCLTAGGVSAAPGYNSTGCIADCVQNHGYKSGNCTTAVPKVPASVYSNEERQNFCLCNSTSTA